MEESFDSWLSENIYAEDIDVHRVEGYRSAWNAAVSACSDQVSLCEGTDFDISLELTSEAGA